MAYGFADPQVEVSRIASEAAAARSQGALPRAPTAQSEPTPKAKPAIDPRPYYWFKKNDPVIAGWIDNAARVTGASPERLAAHKWLESGKSRTAPRGAAGEIGIMQFMPSTWREVDKQGRLNPADGQQAMILAGTYINHLDFERALGKDTPASVAAYNGSGPKARAYARRIFGNIPDSEFNIEGSKASVGGFMQAAQQGPTAAMKYMVESTPRALQMSDKWRHVEALLVQAALTKGDIRGAAAARDFVGSLAHAGTNQHLMAAAQALQTGQGATAAQHLAAAHAFFPDGTIGRFYSDGKGVFAERIDEDDPSRNFGASPVTLDAIGGLLNQTKDPQLFLKTLMDQQQQTAQIRLAELHGEKYIQDMQLAPMNVALDFDAKTMAEQGRNDRFNQQQAMQTEQFNAAEQNKMARAAMRSQGEKDYSKEVNSVYDPAMAPDDPTLGRKSVIYDALLKGNVPGPMAQQLVGVLSSGNYQVQMSPDKKTAGIFTKDQSGKVSGQPIALLPPTLLHSLSSPISVQPRQTATPIPATAGVQPRTPTMNGRALNFGSPPYDEDGDE